MTRDSLPLLLDLPGTELVTGLCEQTILRLCKLGYFPRSLQPAGYVFWRTADIFDWVEGGCGQVWEGISDEQIAAQCEEAELRWSIEHADEEGPPEASGFNRDAAITTDEPVFVTEGEEDGE